MADINHTVRALLNDVDFRAQLIRGGVASIAIKLAYVGLALAQSIVLARVLGPAGYGVFAYVFAVVNVLSFTARFGLTNLLVRETANGQVDEAWGEVHGLWRWSTLLSLCIGGVLCVLSVVVLWVWGEMFTPLQTVTFLWGLALALLMALSNMAGAALRGLRHVTQGQLPQLLMRPALFLVLIVFVLATTEKLTASSAMGLRAAADVGVFMIALWLLLRQESSKTVLRAAPKYRPRVWFLSALPLALNASIQVLNQQTGMLVLGLFAPAETVGTYRVAVQGTALIMFALQAISMVIAPHFARLYRQGELRRLQRLVTLSARVIVLLTLPVAAILIIFGDPIVRLVFGSGYIAAATPLAILAIGQLGRAFFGCVIQLLNMSGHEKSCASATALSAVANVILSFALVPLLGASGVALATTISLLFWNVLLARAATRHVGIRSLATCRLN